MTRRATLPPIASPTALGRLLAALLWVIPVLFFGYYSLIVRWPAGDLALAELGGGPSLVVGVATSRSFSNPEQLDDRSQVYLVWPASLRTLNAYAVSQDARGTRMRPIPFGLLIFGGVYGGWIGGSIWYLLRRSRT